MIIAGCYWGPNIQKYYKQKSQTEHNRVKNPNWQEAGRLAIYKYGQGVELGSAVKQLQVVVREDRKFSVHNWHRKSVKRNVQRSFSRYPVFRYSAID